MNEYGEPTNVNEIVRARIESARRKAAADKEARSAFAAARSNGLARRHAAKLRHLAQTTPDTTEAPGASNPGASSLTTASPAVDPSQTPMDPPPTISHAYDN